METINDLFQKYAYSVGPVLEEDRYFQYLYESVSAADKTIEQKSQVLHKVVDEEWLTVVEESLDALNNIIEKPRRFIARSEELVPVSLAKKITADSVRHLSQNTQFINSDENGEINPSKILNVTNEDSYDLYENRFIYHLIQRLVTFIDKRTDVIFWSSADETRNVMSFETTVDDAYEQIEYKVEMKITNRQSFAENDSDNMTVFMRIDRVRRLVMALKNSSFCELMAGCSKVRSPIQRTNLMMKDRDYRTCYALWQFLERYDSIGYSIVEQDKAYEIDEEYLIQLYTQFITCYALFKTLTVDDQRDIDSLMEVKRKFHKPKFIRQIREEFVENRDLPDVEIRRIFEDHVTQAQLDAEEALANEKKLTEKLQSKIDDYRHKAEVAISQRQDAEDARDHAEQQMHDAVAAKENAEAASQKAINDAALHIAKVEEDAAKKLQEAAEIRRSAELERDDAIGAMTAAESRAKAAKEEMQAAVEEKEAAIKDRDEKVVAAKKESEIKVSDALRMKNEAERFIGEAEKEVEAAKAEALKADELRRYAEGKSESDQRAREEAERLKAEADSERDKALAAKEQALAEASDAIKTAEEMMRRAEELRLTAEAKIKEAEEGIARGLEMQRAADEESKEAQRSVHDAQAHELAAHKAEEKALKRLEKETQARIRAQEKAKEGTLGKYIADWLSGNKRETHTGDGGSDDPGNSDKN